MTHHWYGNAGICTYLGFMGIRGSGRTRSNFLEGKSDIFPSKMGLIGTKNGQICYLFIGLKSAENQKLTDELFLDFFSFLWLKQ